MQIEAAPPAQAGRGSVGATVERQDFHVLYDVKSALRRFMFESDLAKTLDIDDRTGRVIVGVDSAEDEERIRADMTPQELAVTDFEPARRATPAVAKAGAASVLNFGSSTLRSLRNSAFRPLIAGAETEFRNSAGAGTSCSQGPAVRLSNGAYGFLTNAHCTLDRTRIDGVQFFQPQPVPSDLIGIETAEPAYRSGLFITDGYYSDAAFVRTQGGIGLQGKMTNADGCTAYSPDCIENGIITDITGNASYLAVNTALYKTGRSTGSTAGRIVETCRDEIPLYENRRILCSSVVNYDAAVPSQTPIVEGGDSGSAVLLRSGVPGTNSGLVAGLLWGRYNALSFIFSPWENIWQQERAGTNYGLPVTLVTSSQGTVANATSTGGGGGGTGGGGGGGGGGCNSGSTSGPTTTIPEQPCNP